MNQSQMIFVQAMQSLQKLLKARSRCRELKDDIGTQEFLLLEAQSESRDSEELEQKLAALQLAMGEAVLAYRDIRNSTIVLLGSSLENITNPGNLADVQDALNYLKTTENPFDDFNESPVKTTAQRSSRVPVPPKSSEIPGPNRFLKPPAPLAQMSRIPPPSSSRVPKTKPPASKMQAPSQLPQTRPSQVTNKAEKIQQDIDKHKLKAQQALKIRKSGNFGNLKREAEIKSQPRLIPLSEVQERQEGLKAMLEGAKTVGSFKKRASRPAPLSSCKRTKFFKNTLVD